MIRYIKLSNEKNRDAEVTYRSLNSKVSIKLGINAPGDVINKRVLKSTSNTDFSTLIKDFKVDKTEDEQLQKSILLSDQIIKDDPEIDFEIHVGSMHPKHQKVHPKGLCQDLQLRHGHMRRVGVDRQKVAWDIDVDNGRCRAQRV